MAEGEEEMPKLVWTFPMVRFAMNRPRLMNLGKRMDVGKRIRDNNIRENIQERASSLTESEDDSVDEVMDEISDLRESSDSVFSGSSELDYSQEDEGVDGDLVEIEEGAFVPTRVRVDEGDTVMWVNEDSSQHNIMSISGENLSSGPLDSGDEYEYTFSSEGVTIYIDRITGGENMSGAVIVGDATMTEDLPSESNVERVLFEEDDDESEFQVRSMSKAAEDKEEMMEEVR